MITWDYIDLGLIPIALLFGVWWGERRAAKKWQMVADEWKSAFERATAPQTSANASRSTKP